MKCQGCQTKPGNAFCGGCQKHVFCSESCSWDHRKTCLVKSVLIGTRVRDMPPGNEKTDALHLKCMEARSLNQVYWYDDDTFVERFDERLQQDNVLYLPHYALAGTQRMLFIPLQEYEFRLRQTLSSRIFFKETPDLEKCLENWIPVRVIGQGNFGSVYQVCNINSCGYAAKISILEKPETGQAELNFYREASNAGLAPLVEDGFICGNALVIITERYESNLFVAMVKAIQDRSMWTRAEWKQVLQSVFDCVWKLLEINIVHSDTKVCNFLYNAPNDVKIADFGRAVFLSATASRESMMLGQVNLFMKSIARPEEYCQDAQTVDMADDVFNIRGTHRDQDEWVREILQEIFADPKNKAWNLQRAPVAYLN